MSMRTLAFEGGEKSLQT